MPSVPTPDGRTLDVRETGDPAGVPVLALHGTPGAGTFYKPHARDAEERGIRLVSYARPGYAGSTPHPGRRIADCVADIAAVCDALGIDRFCVWGYSGGGPHALAAAALLPKRVLAAASLASVAPYDGEGLDFLAGMGEQNVHDFRLAEAGGEPHRAGLERQREEFVAASADDLVSIWETLLGPGDRQVATHETASFIVEDIRAAIEGGVDGWVDDELAITKPWGFTLDAIRVPVLLWQGEQDLMVPPSHGRWLAEQIPGVDARITAEDGHLTIGERHLPEVHAWLLERARLNDDA